MSENTFFTKVFVGGLAWETKSQTLHDHFIQYGNIIEAVVLMDKYSGRSKGYGFVLVTFVDPEAAQKATIDPNPIIDNRRANCNLSALGAKQRYPKSPNKSNSPLGYNQRKWQNQNQYNPYNEDYNVNPYYNNPYNNYYIDNNNQFNKYNSDFQHNQYTNANNQYTNDNNSENINLFIPKINYQKNSIWSNNENKNQLYFNNNYQDQMQPELKSNSNSWNFQDLNQKPNKDHFSKIFNSNCKSEQSRLEKWLKS